MASEHWRLADFATPIASGLKLAGPGMGRLSRDRAARLAASLRALDADRLSAEIASRSYFVGPVDQRGRPERGWADKR